MICSNCRKIDATQMYLIHSLNLEIVVIVAATLLVKINSSFITAARSGVCRYGRLFWIACVFSFFFYLMRNL